MSDPVGRVEIEDVLSSIRRLVSEEKKSDSAEAAPKPGGPPREKLVLTQSHKVQDPVADTPKPNTGNVVEMARKPSVSEHAPAVEKEADRDRSEGSDIGSLGQKIAALEAVIGGTDEQWEPDHPVGDDYAGTQVAPHPWERDAQPKEEAAEPAAHKATAEASADASAAQIEPADLPETAIAGLDEDALRELVSQIVRQELQGALGERITRNVRKMVRREIQMALSAKSFD